MTEPCAHDHPHTDAGEALDQSLSRGFYVAIALTAVTLVAEVAGGFWTNSLALLSDAAHVFMDLFALVLSLAAIRLARFPADDRRTYGWHRAEILASLVNGLTLLLIAAGILHQGLGPPGAPGGGQEQGDVHHRRRRPGHELAGRVAPAPP